MIHDLLIVDRKTRRIKYRGKEATLYDHVEAFLYLTNPYGDMNEIDKILTMMFSGTTENFYFAAEIAKQLYNAG